MSIFMIVNTDGAILFRKQLPYAPCAGDVMVLERRVFAVSHVVWYEYDMPVVAVTEKKPEWDVLRKEY